MRHRLVSCRRALPTPLQPYLQRGMASIKSRDRTSLRRRPIRQVKQDFVNVTPAPAFGRIIGFDDRVIGCMKMLRRVAVGRLIAATDMTAGSADAQMQPWIVQLQAFFAPKGTGNNVANSRQMPAALCHSILNVCSSSMVACGQTGRLDGRQLPVWVKIKLLALGWIERRGTASDISYRMTDLGLRALIREKRTEDSK